MYHKPHYLEQKHSSLKHNSFWFSYCVCVHTYTWNKQSKSRSRISNSLHNSADCNARSSKHKLKSCWEIMRNSRCCVRLSWQNTRSGEKRRPPGPPAPSERRAKIAMQAKQAAAGAAGASGLVFKRRRARVESGLLYHGGVLLLLRICTRPYLRADTLVCNVTCGLK